MSEIINNNRLKIEKLKDTIKDIHNGISVEKSNEKLKNLFSELPHGAVVTAEQELIAEGLPEEEIIKYCDLHSAALKGVLQDEESIDLPEAHPVDTFRKENAFLTRRIEEYAVIIKSLTELPKDLVLEDELNKIKSIFNDLGEVEKHYARKENLLFPYLEKNDITGPPMVMWAKDDEIRSFLKSSFEVLKDLKTATPAQLIQLDEMLLSIAVNGISEMIYKEEKILFPMCMDTLAETDWYQIYLESDDTGYTLYAPANKWKPENITEDEIESRFENDLVKFSTGSFSMSEIEAIFKLLPIDLTFVDADDRVKFFSEGPKRIFQRNKSIIGRLVQHCHPPSSVHIVEKILEDFKAGKQDKAAFWIRMHGMFVHIAYYAVSENGKYLGTLEVTQEVGQYAKLEGERRILNYED
ncbi:MAG: hypothetical protein SCALA702_30060 [Melioribacteraceae bacterium]|nr:MAG: hypothetical protein SCALA702_30060 [Melioribacteraceae bacterium]